MLSTLLIALSPVTSAQTLVVGGACPGPMTLSAAHLTPYGSVGFISADGVGNAVVPAGSCAGTVTGLSPAGIALRAVRTADGAGNDTVSPTIRRCGDSHWIALNGPGFEGGFMNYLSPCPQGLT